MQIKTIDQLKLHVYSQLRAHVVDNQLADDSITTILVGLSGGLDSCVLLHLLSTIHLQLENVSVKAIHVNHGIHESSSDWAVFCQHYCQELSIPLIISEHDLRGVMNNREAVFRQTRYQVFSDQLPQAGLLLTAHHQSDQAETILFNLVRGAGIQGLRAMKSCVTFATGLHLRPLLQVPKALLFDYAGYYDLKWIDDPSNLDLELGRNYLRHHIIPQIEARWPAAQSTITRAGENLLDAEQILHEIGMQDINFCDEPNYAGVINNAYLAAINLDRIHQLSIARQLNLLRLWLLENTKIAVSAGQVQQIHQDLCLQSNAGLFEYKGWELRVFKNTLYLMQAMPKIEKDITEPVFRQGSFIFEDLSMCVRLHGKSTSKQYPDLTFAARQGGERIRRNGQSRQLKSIYQESSIPTWERDRIPLIYSNKKLIAVPGVVVADDCPFRQPTIHKYTALMT